MLKRLFGRVAMISAGILLVPGVTLARDEFAGKFEGEKLSVQITADGGAYAGTLRLGQQQFPLKAQDVGGRLQGTFATPDGSYDFAATLQGETMTLVSGGTNYSMKKLLQPANPLDRPQLINPLARAGGASPAGGALADYSVVTATDSGKSLTVQKPRATSVQSALESTFPDLARYFDGRPAISGAFEDSRDHGSGGASFTAQLSGQPVKGFVSCKVGEKGAVVAVVYCRTDAPAAEWTKLTTTPAGEPAPGRPPAAPVLKEYQFPDGTGSIGLAEGWTTAAQSCLGAVQIQGPADQSLSIGNSFSVVTPNSTAVQMQRQLEANARQMRMQPPPPMQMLIAPYTGPTEALVNLVPQLSRMSRQNNGPAIEIDHVVEQQKIKANLQGGSAAIVNFGVTRTLRGEAKHFHAIAQIEVDPLGADAWMMYAVQATAPDKTFDADYPVMLAMVSSMRTNDRVMQQKTRENIDASNQRFAAMQQAHRDQMDTYDRQNKAWEQRQTIQSRSNADFDEVIRGYRTVEDTRTGERSSVNLGNVDHIVDRLNEYDPGRYKQIPLRDEMYPLAPVPGR